MQRRRFATMILVTLVVCGAAPVLTAQTISPVSGQWSARGPVRDGVQFLFRRTGGDSTSTPIPRSDLRSVSSNQLEKPDVMEHFEIVRDAGTVRCEGYLRGQNGGGTFTFAANAGFIEALRELGYPALTDEETFRAAILDVGLDFVRTLHQEGLRPGTIDRLISLRIHGVTSAFISSLKVSGYETPASDQLVSMQIHGVSIDFINELATLGYRQPPINELIALRIHGVTPAAIRRMQTTATRPLSLEDVIQATLRR